MIALRGRCVGCTLVVMGAALCLLSAAAFGAMAVFGKFAYAEGVSVQALLLVRFGLAALLLLALAQLTSRRGADRPRARSGAHSTVRAAATGAPHATLGADPSGEPAARAARRPALVAFFGLGCVGYAAQAGCYFAALRVMDASLVAILFYTYPALVTLAAALLGRERLTTRRACALGLTTVGVLLVLGGSGVSVLSPSGVALAVGAALTYTCYILTADRVGAHLPAVRMAALAMSGAASTMVAAAAVAVLTGPGIDLALSWRAWFWLACIAVISTVVAMVAFLAGITRVGPSTAAILSTLEPVVTVGLAAAVLGETPTLVQLVGGACVLACVVVLQTRPRASRACDVDSAQLRGAHAGAQ